MVYSATLKGIYFDIVGRFFSIYCIYKIFIVSVAAECKLMYITDLLFILFFFLSCSIVYH